MGGLYVMDEMNLWGEKFDKNCKIKIGLKLTENINTSLNNYKMCTKF